MSSVGIIANPASGKDIRRLVARASILDNNEKVNIVVRLLLALEDAGVDEVLIMPDSFAIGCKALDQLARHKAIQEKVRVLEMRYSGEATDSTRAAEGMRELGVNCLITIGGDGTNRAVAKGCGDVPLLPLSTGTNNVFPYWIDSTTAGLAAAAIATGVVPVEAATGRTKRLEILQDGEVWDIALVDAVVCDYTFVGARAVWEVERLRQVVQTCASPANIGLSAIGGCFESIGRHEPRGLHLVIGAGGRVVRAPIAPGLLARVPVQTVERLDIGDEVPVQQAPALIAVDGERELEVRRGSEVAIRLSAAGPRVVAVTKTLELAARDGFFRVG